MIPAVENLTMDAHDGSENDRSMEVDTTKASTHWKDPSISKLLAIIASGVFGFFSRIFLLKWFDSNLLSPTRGDINFLVLWLHCLEIWDRSALVRCWARWSCLRSGTGKGHRIGRGTHVLQSCKITLESQPTVPFYTSQKMVIIISFTIKLTFIKSLFFWRNLLDGFFWWHWWMFLVLAEGRAEGLGCRSAFGVRWLCTMVALQGNFQRLPAFGWNCSGQRTWFEMANINSKSRSDRSWEERFQYQKMQQGAFVEIYAPPWKYSRLKSRLNICSQGVISSCLACFGFIEICDKLWEVSKPWTCFGHVLPESESQKSAFRWSKTYMMYHRPVGSKIIRCRLILDKLKLRHIRLLERRQEVGSFCSGTEIFE